MKVALYIPWIQGEGRAECAALELTGRSRHDWTIFTHHFDASDNDPAFAERNIEVVQPSVAADRRSSDAAQTAERIGQCALPLEDYDSLVVVSEGGIADSITIANPEIPTICLCVSTFASTANRRRAGDGFLKPRLNAANRRAWKNYQKVFCLNSEVRDQVLEHRLAPQTKIDDVWLGTDVRTIKPSLISEKYILFPEVSERTGEIDLGIQAFERFCADDPANSEDFSLVVVEKGGANQSEDLGRRSSNPRVRFVQADSDEELDSLYDRCWATVFASLNDEPGMTPAKAMIHAKPVIAVHRGGLRETVQNGKSGYVVESDSAAMGRAMADLAGQPKMALSMGKAGRRHLRKFDWQKFIDPVDLAIEDVVAGSVRPSERSANRKRLMNRVASIMAYRGRTTSISYFPTEVWVELTNLCNLKCVMCPNGLDVGDHTRGFMTWDVFRKVIREIAQHGCNAQLFLGGESLLNKEAIRMIRYAKNAGCTVSLSTNATVLDSVTSRHLIESGLDNLNFSFDGFTEEEYERIRVNAKYDNVIGNIKGFLKEKKAMNADAPFTTVYSLMVSDKSAEGREEFIKLFDDLPVDRFLVDTPADWGGRIEEDSGIELKGVGRKQMPCHRVWQNVAVRWDGSVVPCCADFFGDIILGQVQDESLETILNSPGYQDFRRKMVEGDLTDFPLCAGCGEIMPEKLTMGVPAGMFVNSKKDLLNAVFGDKLGRKIRRQKFRKNRVSINGG